MESDLGFNVVHEVINIPPLDDVNIELRGVVHALPQAVHLHGSLFGRGKAHRRAQHEADENEAEELDLHHSLQAPRQRHCTTCPRKPPARSPDSAGSIPRNQGLLATVVFLEFNCKRFYLLI